MSARAILRATRPHHWTKNLLLFVPLVTSHRLGDPTLLLRAAVAGLAFSLVASAVYVLNDLIDRPEDRLHPTKRRRPFASGELPASVGVAMVAALLVLGSAASIPLPAEFRRTLLAYLALTTAYSTFLKRRLLVDVLALAGLYTLRILAGGAATGIVISSWLLAFSVFFFLSLAFAKRYTELASTGEMAGRGYRATDLEMIRSMGPTSGFLGVVVLCLYLNSPEVRALHGHPARLWLACPVLLYWILRVWFLASRGELDDDPIVFAIRDGRSYLAGLVLAAILAASI